MVGAREDDQELLAADPGNPVNIGSNPVFQGCGDDFQHVIAGLVTAFVVDALEEVDVAQCNRRRRTKAMRAFQFPRHLGHEVPAVIDVG